MDKSWGCQSPRNRAVREMRDSHGVMGVWPCSLTAAQILSGVKGKGLKMVELGAGRACPHYMHLVLGACMVSFEKCLPRTSNPSP